MKKVFLSLLSICSLTILMNGQTYSKHALGIRFSDDIRIDAETYKEISYQLTVSKANRIELDLGFVNYKHWYESSDIYKLVGTYQWVQNIDRGFGFYAGAGAGLGAYRTKGILSGSSIGVNFILAVQAGIQYKFVGGFPFLVSLDLRPECNTDDYWKGSYLSDDIAFSLRFTF